MSCVQVAAAQGKSARFKLATFHVLGGKFDSTIAFVHTIAAIRLLAMVGEIVLGFQIYKSVNELKRHRDYAVEWGLWRLKEFLILVFYCVLIHSVFVLSLVFLSLGYNIFGRCKSLAGRLFRCESVPVGPPQHEVPAGLQHQWDSEGLFLEKLDRVQREMEAGVTWYVHLHRHLEFGAEEAHASKEKCGLPGYWFYSVKELVGMVQSQLPTLRDEHRLVGEGLLGGEITTGKKLTTALESLFHLSRACKTCRNCQLFVSNQTPCYTQDIPQTSRCRHDVDAGRDFAQAGGYPAMLRVLIYSRANSKDAELAARILAGFAAGLSILPWQPYWSGRDTRYILNLLSDDDFAHCTKHLVYVLLRLLRPYATTTKDMVDNSTLRVQEAAASAICSFSQAVSDIHAIVHRPKAEKLLSRDAFRSAASLCYAFTAVCPVGWLLRTAVPDFRSANDVWVKAMQSVLCEPRTVGALLRCARNDVSLSIVADCIRTLSSIWSRRMIYWHRLDKRMEDLPRPVNTIRAQHRKTIVSSLQDLLSLAVHEPEFSVLSQLHLAKIIISQKIRRAYPAIAEILTACLIYWRRALGTRELDWFASETIECLRDLFQDAREKRKHVIEQRIAESPGGLACLRLMLNSHLSITHALRIFVKIEDFNRVILRYSARAQVSNRTIGPDDYAHLCSASAAGLLADLLKVRGVADLLGLKGVQGKGPKRNAHGQSVGGGRPTCQTFPDRFMRRAEDEQYCRLATTLSDSTVGGRRPTRHALCDYRVLWREACRAGADWDSESCVMSEPPSRALPELRPTGHAVSNFSVLWREACRAGGGWDAEAENCDMSEPLSHSRPELPPTGHAVSDFDVLWREACRAGADWDAESCDMSEPPSRLRRRTTARSARRRSTQKNPGRAHRVKSEFDRDGYELREVNSAQRSTRKPVFHSRATGRVTRLITVDGKPRREPIRRILPDDPGQSRPFFLSLFKSLTLILWDRTKLSEVSRVGGSCGSCWSGIRRYLSDTKSTLTARFILLFWESLGNPAWRPAFGMFEDLEPACTSGGKELMETFERSLNSLLGTRNAIRVVDRVLETCLNDLNPRLLTLFFPPMVKLLIKPCVRLDVRLKLSQLEASCNEEIRETLIEVLTTIAPLVLEMSDPTEEELEEDALFPSKATVQSSRNELCDWLRRNYPQLDTDTDGQGGDSTPIQLLWNVTRSNPCPEQGPAIVVENGTGNQEADASPTGSPRQDLVRRPRRNSDGPSLDRGHRADGPDREADDVQSPQRDLVDPNEIQESVTR
ncbi:hypothetical protein CBR_g55468 [Chara braunii]|uniref:Uncharacterized protein n=1 Tax=Chara braunii TaxID=69332 RepID=A0A388K7U0_CHABU|nr:hypothetical protein CBR_g55468 [Chara braunii]|eukprot:GBG66124.1 hypothetical protein CBR_g55468 [Chara braunii]